MHVSELAQCELSQPGRCRYGGGVGAPLGLLLSELCRVSEDKDGTSTGYTRKLFHALIFLRGPNDRLYEALAREQDGPARGVIFALGYISLRTLLFTDPNDRHYGRSREV